MYFIARNNKMYSYIASKSPLHRYIFTTVIFGMSILVALYCVYYPLHLYNVSLEHERDRLQKKYGELNHIHRQAKIYEQLIEKAEKAVCRHTVPSGNTEQDELLFIIEAVSKCGLHLQSYSLVKEIDKEWYTKEIVHVDVTGNLDQCINFIEYSKKSEKLISMCGLSVDCTAAVCKMNCDIAYIAIKNPSTLSKLKG